jgi:hypothetical protein
MLAQVKKTVDIYLGFDVSTAEGLRLTYAASRSTSIVKIMEKTIKIR